jgi:hypothetical protein
VITCCPDCVEFQSGSKPGCYFSPGWSLILIVHSCQLSKPTGAHVSFAVGIFRCENAVFSQSGERVSNFVWKAFQPRSDRVPTAFQPRSDRVPTAFQLRSDRVRNAFGTRSERERSVRLFLSSTVYVNPTKVGTKPPTEDKRCIRGWSGHCKKGIFNGKLNIRTIKYYSRHNSTINCDSNKYCSRIYTLTLLVYKFEKISPGKKDIRNFSHQRNNL